MSYGDRISKFMKEIGNADRIFIVLSDKYLKSTYCMSELLDAWINCKENEEEFVRRTRVFVLDCAKIGTPKERAHYAIYWREKFNELEELIKTEGHDMLAHEDLVDHARIRRFVYEIPNILKLVQDVLRPRSFDEFTKYSSTTRRSEAHAGAAFSCCAIFRTVRVGSTPHSVVDHRVGSRTYRSASTALAYLGEICAIANSRIPEVGS